MGISTSFAAVVVLALYVDSNVAGTIYAEPIVIWAFVPLCLFWQCRIWLAAVRGEVFDDPIVFAAKDSAFWFTIVAAAAIYTIALLGTV